jgi:hypothetical protein
LSASPRSFLLAIGLRECARTISTFHKEIDTMTRDQFAALCARFGIHPAVALENEEIVQALRERNDAQIERILANDF